VTGVQATVASWSGTTRGGSVLLDDGTMLDFDHAVFDRSGLRLLRFGQRVRLRVTEDQGGRRIAALTIATLPWPDAGTDEG
jgi:2-phospho-L-lactate guanylyltransferase